VLELETEIIRRSVPQSQPLSGQVDPLLGRIYAARGIASESELVRELGALPAPSELPGTAQAAGLLHQTMEESGKILIMGDFDADGATSCALAVLGLRAMGAADVDYLVPNRFKHGYGLTPEIVDAALELSPDLLVTVDNGISSVAGVAAANTAGVPVLVTDHHLPGRELPQAAVIVNPNLSPDQDMGKNLAGVGVLFYVLLALRSRLREHNWFSEHGIEEPNLADFLDLVALGTVADVVPLDHLNRILVHQGIRRIRAGHCRPGIKALLRVAGRNQQQHVAADMGFAIGPRLNAAGRLEDMSLGIETLITDSEHQAEQGAAELDRLNRQRREIEDDMRQQATAHLESLELQDSTSMPFGLCIFDPGWHQGVIGILASRIKEHYHRPVIAFAAAGDGWIKGSARSVPGLHIRDILDSVAVKHPGLIDRFGGHAMAAGLTLGEDSFKNFCDAFDHEVREHLAPEDIRGVIHSDGELQPEQLTLELAQTLREAGPWGQHFPEPLFDGEFTLVNWRIVGEKHLKMVLATGNREVVLDAIAFNQADKLPQNDQQRMVAAYRLDVNEFRGNRSVQMIIQHLEWV
jgi:single-stranded-DNA-specific exonuclease